MNSLWSETAARPHFESLSQDTHTDVLVIGGGIVGILCAYKLKQAGADPLLVEANTICGGITQNTTAKITVQHGLIYDKLIRTFGTDTARLYLQANQTALDAYRAMAQNIDCDLTEYDAFAYSLHDREKLEHEIRALKRIGCEADLIATPPLPFDTAGAVRIRRQLAFHPLKFLFAVARELRIAENTKVLEFIPGGVRTNCGKITANHIVVATHFPFLNKHGAYFLKLYQHRSYVLALKNAPPVNGMYIDEDEKGLSFRDHSDLLLLGGGSHRTGKQGGNWQELREFARKYYPQAKETAHWATQDCMSLDGIPYIGLYAKSTPHLYVATGFNKWGMTAAMAAADILTDLIGGRDNPYAAVFDPSRSILHPQLAVNLGETVLGLLTPTVPRCPHMGCALKYNPQEHSWDCGCHGSRFTAEGNLIDNPATADKRM